MAKKTAVQNIQTVLKTMILPAPDSKLDIEVVTLTEDMLSSLSSDDFYEFENPGDEIDRLEKQYLADKKHLEMAKYGYQKLDYRFLSWCGENRLPAFVILSLYSRDFEITVEPQHNKVDNIDDVNVKMDPRLPLILEEQCNEAIITLGRLSSEKYNDEALTISAKFQGFVPAKTREIIDFVEKKNLVDYIYIIVDAPVGWQPKQAGQISMRDPLVVGWDDESETMYLVTTFVPVTLEEYVLSQFKQ